MDLHSSDIANGGFLKVGVPPFIINFSRIFHYKPSILGYPPWWKPPNWISHKPPDKPPISRKWSEKKLRTPTYEFSNHMVAGYLQVQWNWNPLQYGRPSDPVRDVHIGTPQGYQKSPKKNGGWFSPDAMGIFTPAGWCPRSWTLSWWTQVPCHYGFCWWYICSSWDNKTHL